MRLKWNHTSSRQIDIIALHSVHRARQYQCLLPMKNEWKLGTRENEFYRRKEHAKNNFQCHQPDQY